MKVDPRKKPSKLEQEPVRPIFLVVQQPQKQNLAYTIQQVQTAAPLVVAPEPSAPLFYTVQPQSAPLVAVPQSGVVESARLEVVPVSAVSASSSQVLTPYSSTFVQVFQ